MNQEIQSNSLQKRHSKLPQLLLEKSITRTGTEWSKGLKAFLPTGRIGCAESSDGLKWRRCKGPLEVDPFSTWKIGGSEDNKNWVLFFLEVQLLGVTEVIYWSKKYVDKSFDFGDAAAFYWLMFSRHFSCASLEDSDCPIPTVELQNSNVAAASKSHRGSPSLGEGRCRVGSFRGCLWCGACGSWLGQLSRGQWVFIDCWKMYV